MSRILIVDDQPKLLKSLQQGFSEEGFDVLTAETAESALTLALTNNPDVLILDRMLPGRDGVEVLRELRLRGLSTAVLLLTARDQVRDRIEGLEAGADDYLVKPFDFGELLARVRALLRRRTDAGRLVLRVNDLEVDPLSRRVTRGGVELDLSRREFELLEFLLRRCNHTVSREELAKEVWREPLILTNVIDVTVKQLRRKLERPDTRPLIWTIRGVGYALRDGAEAAE